MPGSNLEQPFLSNLKRKQPLILIFQTQASQSLSLLWISEI